MNYAPNYGLTPFQAEVQAETTVHNEDNRTRPCILLTEIRDKDGKVVAHMHEEREIAAGTQATFTQKSEPILNPHLWSPDQPYLYHVVTIVLDGEHELDRVETKLGIRSVKFDTANGFFLNGRHLKLIGANVHQMWPFIGAAVPTGLHRRDAEQLKAMGVNWVRLSHYPFDPDFLDALDELGLMAMEEPPTWLSPGPAKWMENLEKSFRSMIRRDRNHPCIILWSPCINHGGANRALVQAAKEEDPTRDRGQDTVPIPMNFQPLEVSGLGALGIEHTGHTFPTERGAREITRRIPNGERSTLETSVNREYEQTKRHWEQVNAAYLKADNAGLAVWCMYDYNTFHNQNELGIVWHGVCDLFRLPKFSYWWHKSELTSAPMAYVVRIDSTHAAVFSNCELVRLLQDDGSGYKLLGIQMPDKSFTASDGREIQYALHHPPFHFTIPANAKALKAEGLIGGYVKATYEWKRFGAPVALTLNADRPTITAGGADLSRIIVTAVDTNGTPVDTCKAPVTFDIEGVGQLIGENPVKLRAGKMIILAQSGFVPGVLRISAQAEGMRPAEVIVNMQPVPADVDMPKDLAVNQPTKRIIVTEPQRGPRLVPHP
jgi:beta-galactosidase